MPRDVLKHNFKQCEAITHCWATERGFNLVSHFAYDGPYNSINLLGKANRKQKKCKCGYGSQEHHKGREIRQIHPTVAFAGNEDLRARVRTHRHIFANFSVCGYPYPDNFTGEFIIGVQKSILIKNTDLGQTVWVQIAPLVVYKQHDFIFGSLSPHLQMSVVDLPSRIITS